MGMSRRVVHPLQSLVVLAAAPSIAQFISLQVLEIEV